MSEEILKALMELFALIIKQDGGVLSSEREYVRSFLNKQLTMEAVREYMDLFDAHAGPVMKRQSKKVAADLSVRDSVKILGICKKINRTLNQEQKVVVLMRLYELSRADRKYSRNRMTIINTVAEVFRISQEEFTAIEQFVKSENPRDLANPAILIITPGADEGDPNDRIIAIRLASVDLYFIKYISNEQHYLNGLPVLKGMVYTFAKGSSLRSQQGRTIYYSDIAARFLSGFIIHKLSFTAENLSFHFREGIAAIDNVSFSVEGGRLVGIMGASGSGKTTLLSLLSGIEEPSSGSIKVNGIEITRNNPALEGVFGFVPQDDLLIEDLTVFENLYYAACQSFGDKSRDEITRLVDHTLSNLGLLEKKDLKVGNTLNKVISGGQRKRLNIALELIREPQVLFLDEPTSGLSSRDSENLMALLRDLTLKGKLVFTVIHQPSSEIYKMLDKVIILDNGGCMAFFGNPVDAAIYFKTLDSQINSEIGQCPSCGNVNPEMIFNIIETQVVDEFGRYTDKRKIKPVEWAAIFNSKYPFTPVKEVKEPPHQNIQRPGAFRQFMIYLSRDFKSKISNSQYVLLTLLEAPILGFILSFIIRYIPNPDSDVYIFSENENIPIYIFMSVIVALFLGLTISAEEIFRDRKILKREQFLNLSRSGYLFSKIAILFLISALQTFLFLMIANPILEIRGMFMTYWIALFTTAFCANMLGLNISASFNSAITIYIVIPLLIIPMMVLSGAMFPFDKLNRKIGNVDKVPVIAELMPTRWTYEALIVAQFKDNRYSRIQFDREKETYYDLRKKISEAEFNKIYRLKALREALETSLTEYRNNPERTGKPKDISLKKTSPPYSKLGLIRNELERISIHYGLENFSYARELTQEKFTPEIADSLVRYLEKLDKVFSKISNSASDRRDKFYNMNGARLKEMENEYYNYKLLELVTKPYERNKILVYNNTLVQNTDPIYLDPYNNGPLSFRTHFYSPAKYIFGIKVDTFVFNITLVLLSTIVLYFLLYYEVLGRIAGFFETLKLSK